LESIDIVNLEEFKNQMVQLLNGEAINLRRFDFKSGNGYYDEKTTKLKAGSEIIIEGIHSFNPLVQNLFKEFTSYKICVNPLVYINTDDHNRISSTDCRKLRRMVRDIKNRGISAEQTLSMWGAIRAGEEKNIFPYLETADVMLNTSLAYELCVLKKYAEKALKEIDENSQNIVEANRLLRLLSLVISLEDESYIPKNSILQEFIK
jgi:uridine kinase